MTLLDFDSVARGDPALDLGAAAAGMVRDSLLSEGDITQGVEAAKRFLASYGVDEPALGRVQAYLEAKLIRIAAGSALRPKARPRAPELIGIALAPPSLHAS